MASQYDGLVDDLRRALITAQADVNKWSAYYAGDQGLAYLAPELERELEGRVKAVVLNWPRTVVDAIDERLDVDGFRLDGEEVEYVWESWKSNQMDEASQIAHQTALVNGRAYVIVGSDGPDGYPLVTIESPKQVFAAHDPRTREITSAIKMWREADGTEMATLYLPDRTVWLRGARVQEGPAYPVVTDYNVPTTSFDVIGEDIHNLGVVPVVQLTNRGGILDQQGTSELADIVDISDAATKLATDLMVSAEFHALPRRYIIGLGEDDATDEEGRPVSELSRLAGRLWAIDGLPSEVTVGQFQEASLQNFISAIDNLAQMVSSVAGLPPYFLGQNTVNPASADAIRSSESRLVKRSERRQRSFGAAWEQVARLVLLIGQGTLPDNASRIETDWVDAGTPTQAQQADAVTKLHASGIIPLNQARIDLGYSAEEIEIMEAEDEKQAQMLSTGGFGAFMTDQAAADEPAALEDGADDAPVE